MESEHLRARDRRAALCWAPDQGLTHAQARHATTTTFFPDCGQPAPPPLEDEEDPDMRRVTYPIWGSLFSHMSRPALNQAPETGPAAEPAPPKPKAPA